jgi:hypothetical protein
VYRMLLLSRFINKHGCHRQFLFLIDQFLKIFSSDQDEISNLYRGPSIDASYQVSVQLAKKFQGRRFLEIDQSETIIRIID